MFIYELILSSFPAERSHLKFYVSFCRLPLAAGAVLVDQYCNPLSDVSLSNISSQLDEIVEKVKKMLSIKNPSHPSLSVTQGLKKKKKNTTRSPCWSASVLSDFELQRRLILLL